MAIEQEVSWDCWQNSDEYEYHMIQQRAMVAIYLLLHYLSAK